MTRTHLAAALMALSSLAALPACSSPSYYSQSSSAATMPARQELSPAMVRQVQTALQQQGLYSGAIDGVWGPQTASALQGFQQSHSLAATGRLNSSTLAALNLSDDTTAPSAQSNATPPNAAPPPATQPATSQQGMLQSDGTYASSPPADATSNPPMQSSTMPPPTGTSTTTSSNGTSTTPAPN